MLGAANRIVTLMAWLPALSPCYLAWLCTVLKGSVAQQSHLPLPLAGGMAQPQLLSQA